ncbi:septum formation initiator family protein [Streptomyces rugosispiralis]|uniref:Septum formation initiator family protein n=1 Tax=Streptomyces rugosispiralis TaxID=2967341 RepID=A0ABT1UUQ9_9ACTN|nr:septum formation initiator family protein [Streptomyces rugosispiralis]MCQ8188840.1 septum formation initiator family protein [Streptomyces rugosispiralis]
MSARGTGPKGRSAPGATTARRTPFVLLVVVLLGSGLIALLLLNSSLNQGSFELSRLEKQTDELTDERQALQQDVDKLSAPGKLERRARELGMVPGGTPVFLNPDGSVSGVPAPATGQPSVLGSRGRVLPPSLGTTPSEASPVRSGASPVRSGASPTPSALAPPKPSAATPSGAGAGTASSTASVAPWGLPTGHSAPASSSASANSTPAPQ